MPQHESKTSFRVAISVDLTWSLRRHTDIFAGIARYAESRSDWRYVVDDFAAHTMRQAKGRPRPYDGMIGAVTPELASEATRRRLPLVNVWANSSEKRTPSVLPDYSRVGALVAEHFLGRGLRRMMCLIRRRDVPDRLVAESVKRHFEAAGGACELVRVAREFAHTVPRWNETRTLIENWILRTQKPAGIFAGVDLLGRHVAELCSRHDVFVPEDVAIIAGHNEPTLCLYPSPALTSVEYGYDRVGFEAAILLDRLLRNGQTRASSILVPPTELVVRGSSDFVYAEEEVITAALIFVGRAATRRIDVSDVAEAASVSRRTLEKRFEKHLGRSVAAEIRRVRLEHAKRLLRVQETPIGEIARVVGFGSSQSFARVFRREVGVSPREYRAQFSES
ncbi:MAG: substrate-binding domain-containing protein [Planctomycetota bacterium]